MNKKMPNKNHNESLIFEILNEISLQRTQINFDSEAARWHLAKEIAEKSERKNAK